MKTKSDPFGVLVTDDEAFISAPNMEDITKCPECGSENYEYKIRVTVRREDLEALGEEEAVIRSDQTWSHVMNCRDCGHQWFAEQVTMRF